VRGPPWPPPPPPPAWAATPGPPLSRQGVAGRGLTGGGGGARSAARLQVRAKVVKNKCAPPHRWAAWLPASRGPARAASWELAGCAACAGVRGRQGAVPAAARLPRLRPSPSPRLPFLPRRQVEFDILFASGIDALSSLLEAAEASGAVGRRGPYYYFGEARLGQGREGCMQVGRPAGVPLVPGGAGRRWDPPPRLRAPELHRLQQRGAQAAPA
jgi:hypothetical protein